MIKILVNGASGRMGRAMASKILLENDMEIVAAVDVKGAGADIGILPGIQLPGCWLKIISRQRSSALIQR